MKRIVWKKADGSLRISCPDISKKLDNETEDEFYQRVIARWKELDPTLSSLDAEIKDESDLPPTFDDIEKFRIKANGKIEVDPTVKLPHELKKEKQDALKGKLKSALSLTDEELDLLIGQ